MRKSFPSRRLLGLAAIYVVVLQALLLPLAVAAGSPETGSLCISSGADTQAPAQTDTGCACACAAGCGTQCCAHGLSGAPRAAIVYDPTFAWVLAPALTFEAVTQAAIRLPQNPRAPPVA